MELETITAFTRDLRRLRDAALRRRVDSVITEIEAAASLAEIAGVRRVVTSASGRYYRIRIGQYRLGLATRRPLFLAVAALVHLLTACVRLWVSTNWSHSVGI